jgi:hypothetical protein
MVSFDVTTDNQIFVLNSANFLRYAVNTTGKNYINPSLIDGAGSNDQIKLSKDGTLLIVYSSQYIKVYKYKT